MLQNLMLGVLEDQGEGGSATVDSQGLSKLVQDIIAARDDQEAAPMVEEL